MVLSLPINIPPLPCFREPASICFYAHRLFTSEINKEQIDCQKSKVTCSVRSKIRYEKRSVDSFCGALHGSAGWQMRSNRQLFADCGHEARRVALLPSASATRLPGFNIIIHCCDIVPPIFDFSQLQFSASILSLYFLDILPSPSPPSPPSSSLPLLPPLPPPLPLRPCLSSRTVEHTHPMAAYASGPYS